MYEIRDKDIIDYHTTDIFIGGKAVRIREPIPKNFNKGRYAVCIGAAQTFGCFAENPFPLLLNNRLDFPFINLGQGGASANAFNQPHIMDFLNNSCFVIIQIMSARGEENSSFKPNQRMGQRKVINKETEQTISTKEFYKELLENGNLEKIKNLISESRNNWIINNIDLLKSIRVPKILFWFSQRNPSYQEKYTALGKLFSKFPQLVNEEMVNSIKPFADDYVECISIKGIPQKLVSYRGGTPRLYKRDGTVKRESNSYYPSPEMHLEAAQKLEKICLKYIPRN